MPAIFQALFILWVIHWHLHIDKMHVPIRLPVLFVDRYHYWRLASNHKSLHYGDCTESGDPSIDQLQNKGNTCPLMGHFK